MAGRVLLLVNPVSRHGRDAAQEAERLLIAAGFAVTSPDARDPGNYAALVRGYRGQVETVVVGGGDGSVHLALPGILDIGAKLGVIPLGTANNFARNLGLPTDLAEACAVIAGAQVREVDVAEANGTLFLNVAGLGLSTVVNQRIPRELKKRWGVLAYMFYAFRIASGMRPFHVEISCDGSAPVRVKTFQVTVCSGKYYGSGLPVHEDARIDDGALDLSSTEVSRWWHGLFCLPALLRGRPHKHAALRWMRGARFEIRTRKRMKVDTDGELSTATPVTFCIHPRKVSVLVPTMGRLP